MDTADQKGSQGYQVLSSSRSNGRECGLPLGVLSPESPSCVRGCTVVGCSGSLPAVGTVWMLEGTGIIPVSMDAGKRTETAVGRACGRSILKAIPLAYANEMQMGRGMVAYANEMR